MAEAKKGWVHGGNAKEHDSAKSDCWYVFDKDEDRVVAKVLHEQYVDLVTAAPDLYAAAKEFVEKVERGEARSKRSYAAFKAALAKATPA